HPHKHSTTTDPSKIHPHSLHDALPIYNTGSNVKLNADLIARRSPTSPGGEILLLSLLSDKDLVLPSMADKEFQKGTLQITGENRSEEHTSELQSRVDLVCRLPLEKKKT